MSVEPGPAFSGRIPIEIRNLPQGVRVLNIGLNGVLVTEKQTERTVTLDAEPWAEVGEPPFDAAGRAGRRGPSTAPRRSPRPSRPGRGIPRRRRPSARIERVERAGDGVRRVPPNARATVPLCLE